MSGSRISLTDALQTGAMVLLSLSLAIMVGFMVLRPSTPRGPAPIPLQFDTLPEQVWESLLDGGRRVGSEGAPATVVVFTDYECPFCAAADRTLETLRADFGSDLAVVYRHYPLLSIHPNAYHEARLAECAAEEGFFHRL